MICSEQNKSQVLVFKLWYNGGLGWGRVYGGLAVVYEGGANMGKGRMGGDVEVSAGMGLKTYCWTVMPTLINVSPYPGSSNRRGGI